MIKIKGYTAPAEGEILKTGNRAYHAPAGWVVYADTSWDRRGFDVAAREGDIEVISHGSPTSLSRVRVLPGRSYLTDDAVRELLRLAHGDQASVNSWLGMSDMGHPEVEVDVT